MLRVRRYLGLCDNSCMVASQLPKLQCGNPCFNKRQITQNHVTEGLALLETPLVDSYHNGIINRIDFCIITVSYVRISSTDKINYRNCRDYGRAVLEIAFISM
jgi:hypothetical protein